MAVRAKRDDEDRRVGDVELRARDNAAPTITGYASVFGRETVIAGLFREVIAPDAFNDAVGRDDVRALFNHDPSLILGRTAAGTLRLEVDARGLRYEIDPPTSPIAAGLVESIRRGDVSQSSFGFRVTKEEWQHPATANELPLRTVRGVELFDVSPVTYPAYPETSVSARDAAASARTATAEGLGLALARMRETLASQE